MKSLQYCNMTNQKYSDEEFKELYERGLNDYEIAEKLGVHQKSVWRRRKKFDLPPNSQRRKFSEEGVLEELKELKEELGREPVVSDDKSLAQVARKYFGSWREAKRKAGMEAPHRGGPKHPPTVEKIREVLEEKGAITRGRLMEAAGASRSTIGRWIRKLKEEGELEEMKTSISSGHGGREYPVSKIIDLKPNSRVVFTDPIALGKFVRERIKFELSEELERGKKRALTTYLEERVPEATLRYLRSFYNREEGYEGGKNLDRD